MCFRKTIGKSNVVAILMTTLISFAAQAETLRDVTAHMLCSNPDYLASQASEEANRRAVQVAQGEFLPQVSAFASTARERTSSVAQRLSTMTDSTTLERTESRISASQLLFNGGRVVRTVQARRLDYNAAQFRTHSVREALVFQTADLYLNVLRFRRLVAIARSNVKVHQETLAKARAKFKAGAGRRADVELGISRLARAGAQLDGFVGDLQEVTSRYIAITGLEPSPNMVAPRQDDHFLPAKLCTATRLALAHNPIVHEAHSQFLASDARVGVALSTFWPSISAEASASDNENLDGIEGPNRDNTIALVGRYDLFRGGSDYAAYKLSTAERLRAMRDAQQVQREIVQELRVAWAQMDASRAEIEKRKINVKASGVVVEDFKKQFEIGARTLFDVLDSENDYFTAKVALTNAQYRLASSYYRILQSTGRITPVVLGHG